jgi:hypothetical protein
LVQENISTIFVKVLNELKGNLLQNKCTPNVGDIDLPGFLATNCLLGLFRVNVRQGLQGWTFNPVQFTSLGFQC